MGFSTQIGVYSKCHMENLALALVEYAYAAINLIALTLMTVHHLCLVSQ